jgi:hypothetical protein
MKKPMLNNKMASDKDSREDTLKSDAENSTEKGEKKKGKKYADKTTSSNPQKPTPITEEVDRKKSKKKNTKKQDDATESSDDDASLDGKANKNSKDATSSPKPRNNALKKSKKQSKEERQQRVDDLTSPCSELVSAREEVQAKKKQLKVLLEKKINKEKKKQVKSKSKSKKKYDYEEPSELKTSKSEDDGKGAAEWKSKRRKIKYKSNATSETQDSPKSPNNNKPKKKAAKVDIEKAPEPEVSKKDGEDEPEQLKSKGKKSKKADSASTENDESQASEEPYGRNALQSTATSAEKAPPEPEVSKKESGDEPEHLKSKGKKPKKADSASTENSESQASKEPSGRNELQSIATSAEKASPKPEVSKKKDGGDEPKHLKSKGKESKKADSASTVKTELQASEVPSGPNELQSTPTGGEGAPLEPQVSKKDGGRDEPNHLKSKGKESKKADSASTENTESQASEEPSGRNELQSTATSAKRGSPKSSTEGTVASSPVTKKDQESKQIQTVDNFETPKKTSKKKSTSKGKENDKSAQDLFKTPERKPPRSFTSKLNLFENKNNSDIPWMPKSQGDSFTSPRSSGAGVGYAAAIATPGRRQRTNLVNVETPTLKRGFLALNIASPSTRESDHSKKSPTPAKRFFDRHHSNDKALGYIESAVSILKDKSKAGDVELFIRKIAASGGFPQTRRLSMRDNELVGCMIMAIGNNPRLTKIEVDSAAVFGTINTSLLFQFIDSLRINLHLKSLTFRGVELGNDFLYSLAASMESNMVLEEIDLSQNCFTSEGLAIFCQALANSNSTCRKVNLANQTTPISTASEEDVLEAFEQNMVLTDVQLDFQSKEGSEELAVYLERNKASPPSEGCRRQDQKLLSVLRYEAERAQELWEQRVSEESIPQVPENDWDYLYELAVLFDKHKLKKEVQQENPEDAFVPATQRPNGDLMTPAEKKEFLFGAFQKGLEESVSCFNTDGSFLTDDFIAKYFKETPEEDALDFDFHGQWKLFKRFPIHDPARPQIVTQFVEALVRHPRADELTGINMANTGCGDDFLIALAQQCLNEDSLLPNLHMINFESNCINESGVVALSKLVASPSSCRYLQVIRLENQKGLLKSKAEFALAKALRVNRSVVVVSLRIRNLLERQQIEKYVVRNVDYIRQARQRHLRATGKQRKRNHVEVEFDKVAADDPTIEEVNMVGTHRFLSLTQEEKIKAAASFATNSHVKIVNLTACGIDDEFAQALGKALETNGGIEKLNLESNDISGTGIKALFQGLGLNTSIEEVRLHKQSKMIVSADEDYLADFLDSNTTTTKLGIDLRSKMAQIKLDQKLAQNINRQLKLKAEAKGDGYTFNESVSYLKL